MNKYQKALDDYVKIIAKLKYTFEEDKYLELIENLRLLQELVDKETPKKPIEYLHIAVNEYDKNETKYECPHCHTGECRRREYDTWEDDYTYTEDDRCDVCGGLLDWGKE